MACNCVPHNVKHITSPKSILTTAQFLGSIIIMRACVSTSFETMGDHVCRDCHVIVSLNPPIMAGSIYGNLESGKLSHSNNHLMVLWLIGEARMSIS